MNEQELDSLFTEEIRELIEDEEIIIKTTSLTTLFKVIFAKDEAVIESNSMSKLISENMPQILEIVIEEYDCLINLSKLIGKITHCLSKYYPSLFQ